MTEEIIREKLFDALMGEKNITIYYGGGDVKGSTTGVLDSIHRGYVSFRAGQSVVVSEITGVLPGASDVAKERWMVYEGVCGIEIRQRCDGHEPSLAIVRRGSLDEHVTLVATDAQISVMVAAPEILEALEEVVKGAAEIRVGDEDVTIIVPGLLLGINELVKQARGGE